MRDYARNPAPGALEAARTLLNSRSIAHDTRKRIDELDAVAATPATWADEFGDQLPRPAADHLRAVRELRDTLRQQLGQRAPANLQSWLDTCPLEVHVDPQSGSVRHRGRPGDCVGAVLSIVVDSVVDQQWHRLRACPGCERVFYDRSPNLSRIWCGMYADGDFGRACGTIAKVSAYRARKKTASDAD